MAKTYSIWKSAEGYRHTLVEGTDAPSFANGVPLFDDDAMIATFEAESYEEAVEIYQLTMIKKIN